MTTLPQELEKFKWVLDWKIKDLIRSVGPSQTEAAEVKGRMESMEDELLRYVIETTYLEMFSTDL